MLHASAGKSIDVGPGVLDLAGGFEDRGNGLVADVGQLEELVIGELLRGESVLYF